MQWWKGSPPVKRTEESAHPSPPQTNASKPQKAPHRPGWHKQDPNQTSAAAQEDNDHRIYVSDAFLDLEHQDEETEKLVNGQDQAARAESKIRHPVLTDTPALLKKRQVHFSHIFQALEAQDVSVQDKMEKTTDDVEYSKLSNVQADSMQTLVAQQDNADRQKRPERPLLKHSDKDPLVKYIHEPWLALQRMDEKKVSGLKRQPDLRLIQRDAVLHH